MCLPWALFHEIMVIRYTNQSYHNINQNELPYLGNSYSLTCNATQVIIDGKNLQSPNITYSWFFENSKEINLGQTLSFEHLTYGNVGNYSCQVSVHSTLLPQEVKDKKSFSLATSGNLSNQFSPCPPLFPFSPLHMHA